MKQVTNKIFCTFLLIVFCINCLCVSNVNAKVTTDIVNDAIFMFENSKVPVQFSCDENSTLSISDKHFKIAEHSLKWNYKSNSIIKCNANNIKGTFGIWVYNEKPVNDKIIFEFGRLDKNKADCYFDFNLDFSGWRCVFAAFERDMKGKPHPDMNKMIIKAPSSVKEGTLYFDDIILNSSFDTNQITTGYQVPYTNPDAPKNVNRHWNALYYFSTLPVKEIDSLTDEQIEAITTITNKLDKYFYKSDTIIDDNLKKEIDTEFKKYNIIRTENSIKGIPIFYSKHYKNILPKKNMTPEQSECRKSVEVRKYTDFMYTVVNAYLTTNDKTYKKELKNMFFDLVDHMYDQGWAEGNGQGAICHLGYAVRNYYKSIFLMRNELKETNRLDKHIKTMQWFSGVKRIFEPEKVRWPGINMDTLNTQLQGMLSSILLMENEVEKASYLTALNDWLNFGLLNSPGLSGGIKTDGSLFHHMQSYPAYGFSGITNALPVFYILDDTPYELSCKAHLRVKTGLMAIRQYCNKYNRLVCLSGRHVANANYGMTKGIIRGLNYLALMGTPDGKNEIDKEVASAYLRLADPTIDEYKSYINKYTQLGIKPESEKTLEGNYPMNYSALSAHRRKDWLVGVKGYSRYLVNGETYSHSNEFGHYLNFGSIQILSNGNPINNQDSGFVVNGWDWNRWPGTTTIYLPFNKLQTKHEMLLSDEAYVGGLNIEGKNGMFAMKLHEHTKYNESFKANKSVFMFDNKVICLGSDIQNTSEYNTETTLFQNNLADINEPIWINGEEVKNLGYLQSLNSNSKNYLVDNKQNGYYIPENCKLTISRNKQYSKHPDNLKDTEGNFASAWINHGKSPKNEEYEYAIVVGTNNEKMKQFTSNMKNSETALYTVLRKDNNAHIVKDNISNTIGYALFNANKNINKGLLLAVDTPSMVMTKENPKNLTLSVVDPDLRLYEGIDKEQYDENGNLLEKGIYSMCWKFNESKTHKLRLTIKGKWKLNNQETNCRIISTTDKKTILEFNCQHAKPIEIELSKY